MSGAGSSDSGLDLSGKLIIKAQLGDDIRRIPIHNEDMTYDELILMMQRVFRGSLSPDDDITLKYKDEDGDLVTIFDSSDLAFAIQCSRILKLTILLNGQQATSRFPHLHTTAMRQELRVIRDRVTALLDALDTSVNVPPKTNAEGDAGVSSSNIAGVASPAQPPAAQVISSKEFDPLQPVEQSNTPVHQTPTPNQPQPLPPSSTAPPHNEGEVGRTSRRSSTPSTPAPSTPTATPYHHPHPQHPQPTKPPQQQQPPQQQPPQHPGYPNYSGVAASTPQHGAYAQYPAGQHYGVNRPAGDSGAPPPRSTAVPMAPTSGPPTQATPHSQPSQYYQGYQQYPGYGVSSTQASSYPPQQQQPVSYPSGTQAYPAAPYTTTAGPRTPNPSTVSTPTHPVQPLPPGAPRPPIRYSTVPGFQQWAQQ